jgi:superfamily II DNA or RNA helicase
MSESRTARTGPFIIDNSGDDRKVVHHLRDWCHPGTQLDIATGTFEIGSLLALADHWPRTKSIRILMGTDVSLRTKSAFERALSQLTQTLDRSIEDQKRRDDFLDGVDAIVAALKSRRITCRVYTKDKFHAKAYIARQPDKTLAMAGSSNFTVPGLTENVELNTSHVGEEAATLAAWFDQHWDQGTDVTPDILNTIERHVHLYTPFDIYAKSLHELFLDATIGDQKWERTQSRMFSVLDGYQYEGYRNLLKIADNYDGALLCDGVGLGKTFVGLMLIERLIVHEKKNVILLAPKGAVESVWKPNLKKYLRRLSGNSFSNLFVAAHTDLGLPKSREDFEDARERAHVIIIDEAHHFRNPGAAGTGVGFLEAPRKAQEPGLFARTGRSRYRELFDLVPSATGARKQVFMLTATPINNSFHDLRHMVEIFTQKKEDHFARQLGIHSVTAHFKRMEARLDGASDGQKQVLVDNEEAKSIMAADPLVSALVVQRSRSFVKQKQQDAGAAITSFPPRDPPQRADYSLNKVYGRLLGILERAFDKDEPLFTLPMYYPLAYYKGPSKEIDPGDENRQKAVVALIRTSFLKRFESSVVAFRNSCDRLLIKLLGWTTTNSETPEEKAAISGWRHTHVKLVEAVKARHPHLFRDGIEDADDDEADDDLVEDEFTQTYDRLHRDDYRVADMLKISLGDLDQLVEFYSELDKFDHRNDDKLKKLSKMLKDDAALAGGKVLIFTEFADTADYLLERLTAAKVQGVEQIDSRTKGPARLSTIRRFSPFYNDSSSTQLAEAGESEIRVLISTDVLSEGLNLQDAARLINYDLHWNPVRLMQRIGRVDRRRNPDIEPRLAAQRPDLVPFREKIVFYNFLPPAELNRLLTLYSKVSRKTLRISKALGIEGKKLLTADDDYQDLQHFNESYEGTRSAMELLELERDKLFKSDPSLQDRLSALPMRIFSGRAHPSPDAKAVFFCYRLPVLRDGGWTTDGGPCRWALVTLPNGQLTEEPTRIAEIIRSLPSTPRVTKLPRTTLADAMAKVEKHFKATYFRPLMIPPENKPVLTAWMELN